MALSITTGYNDDLGRVQISWTGASTDADYARVEHSLDQITWSTIRGGDSVPVSAGAGHVDHYDGYVFGIPNYYRVTAIDSVVPAPLSGAMSTGNNTTLNPVIPAGTATGNMMVLYVTHRATAATITTPTGWTRVLNGASHFAVFYRAFVPGDTAPSVVFSGGAAGDSCSAFIQTWPNAQAPAHVIMQTNIADQNVAYPGVSTSLTNVAWVLHAWKQSAATGASAPPGFVNQWGGSNTAGANAESNINWNTPIPSNVQNVPSGTMAWSGGAVAVSKVRFLTIQARTFTDQTSTSITPVLPSPNLKPYWLMNPSRPGQNIRVEITDFSEIQLAGRTGLFEILGRSYPVIVSDFMGSGSFTFSIDAANKTEAKEILGRIALGEPMYLLVADPDDDVDTFYFTALSAKRRADAKRSSWTIEIEAREVAQPNPAVYGSTYVWADVPTDYASWTAVVADPQNVSWSNLSDKISDDVIIVP